MIFSWHSRLGFGGLDSARRKIVPGGFFRPEGEFKLVNLYNLVDVFNEIKPVNVVGVLAVFL